MIGKVDRLSLNNNICCFPHSDRSAALILFEICVLRVFLVFVRANMFKPAFLADPWTTQQMFDTRPVPRAQLFNHKNKAQQKTKHVAFVKKIGESAKEERQCCTD